MQHKWASKNYPAIFKFDQIIGLVLLQVLFFFYKEQIL